MSRGLWKVQYGTGLSVLLDVVAPITNPSQCLMQGPQVQPHFASALPYLSTNISILHVV